MVRIFLTLLADIILWRTSHDLACSIGIVILAALEKMVSVTIFLISCTPHRVWCVLSGCKSMSKVDLLSSIRMTLIPRLLSLVISAREDTLNLYAKCKFLIRASKHGFAEDAILVARILYC